MVNKDYIARGVQNMHHWSGFWT